MKAIAISAPEDEERKAALANKIMRRWKTTHWVAELLPEWRVYYVNYDHFQDVITEVRRDPGATERFLHELQNAILRFAQFYSSQEQRIFSSLKRWAAREMVDPAQHPNDRTIMTPRHSQSGGDPTSSRPTVKSSDPMTVNESDNIIRTNCQRIDRLIVFAKGNIDAIRRIIRTFDAMTASSQPLRQRLDQVRAKKALSDEMTETYWRKSSADALYDATAAATREQSILEKEYNLKFNYAMETDLLGAIAETKAGQAFVRLNPLKMMMTRAFDMSSSGTGRGNDNGEGGEENRDSQAEKRWTGLRKAYLGSAKYSSDNLSDEMVNTMTQARTTSREISAIGTEGGGEKKEMTNGANDVASQNVGEKEMKLKGILRTSTATFARVLSREAAKEEKESDRILKMAVIAHKDRQVVVSNLAGLFAQDKEQKTDSSTGVRLGPLLKVSVSR
eukprot:g8721.t1